MWRTFIILFVLVVLPIDYAFAVVDGTICSVGRYCDYDGADGPLGCVWGSAECRDCPSGYTADGSTAQITTCYKTCDDGTTVYYPNLCPSKCDAGYYLSDDGTCAECYVYNTSYPYYCPGDDLRYECPKHDQSLVENVTDIVGFGGVSYWVGPPATDATHCVTAFQMQTPYGEYYTETNYNGVHYYSTNGFHYWNIAYDGYYLSGKKENYDNHYNTVKPCTNAPADSYYTGAGTHDDAGTATVTDCPWECNSGFGRTAENTCAALCDGGVTAIKTSTGLSVPLLAARNTSPAIYVKGVSGAICYADLVSGTASGAINVQYNGAAYHTVQ